MCQLHISLTRTAQIYLELHFCVELHTKKSPAAVALRPTAVSEGRPANRRVVQWQRAQRRRWRLTSLFDHG